jgi:hypothetical protein
MRVLNLNFQEVIQKCEIDESKIGFCLMSKVFNDKNKIFKFPGHIMYNSIMGQGDVNFPFLKCFRVSSTEKRE